MARRAWKAGGIAAGLAFGAMVTAAAKSPARAGDPPITYLNQNWSMEERNRFYLTSQGSELAPYDWFLKLEQSGSQTLFRENLARYSFLPGPASLSQNPDNLPMGFVPNEETQTFGGFAAKKWVGLTCAACHTGALKYKRPGDATETMLVIDGAPSFGDNGRFMTELAAAIAETDGDGDKFDRFAHRALGSEYNETSKTALKTQFDLFASGFAKLAACSKMPTDHATDKVIEWGPGRVDAFGVIFNSVCNLGLNMPQNNYPPDAPVSYPFLWNIHRQDKIQWFGEVPNASAIDRVARNSGEALGVFAKLHIDPNTWHYESSVNRLNLLLLEEEVAKLAPPRWPETLLGRIDPDAAKRGAKLYGKNCSVPGCHAMLTANPQQVVKITPYPLSQLGTDPNTTVDIHTRMVQTGPLKGRHITTFLSPKFGATAPASDVVRSAVFKALIAFRSPGSPSGNIALAGTGATPPPGTPDTTPPMKTDLDKIGYEARPLNGIWATAPYLHNGSVPSLWQLLLPQEQRLKKFQVGVWDYDPVNVGYQTEVSFGGKTLDTELSGNHNTGHEYGTTLSDGQKRDLIEYLKTL